MPKYFRVRDDILMILWLETWEVVNSKRLLV